MIVTVVICRVGESSCGKIFLNSVLHLSFDPSEFFCPVLVFPPVQFFYQFVVHSIFNSLLKQRHQIDVPEDRSIETSLNC